VSKPKQWHRTTLLDWAVDDDEALTILANLDSAEERGKAIKKALQNAGTEGAKVMRRSFTRSNFPTSKTGNLSKSIKGRAFATASGKVGVVVGPMGKKASHRHLVEGGHAIVGHRPNLVRTGGRARPNPRAAQSRSSTQDVLSDTFVPMLEKWVVKISTGEK
jgi:hypothetical protein